MRENFAEVGAIDDAITVEIGVAGIALTNAPSAQGQAEVQTINDGVAGTVADAIWRALTVELVPPKIRPRSIDVHTIAAEGRPARARRTCLHPHTAHRHRRVVLHLARLQRRRTAIRVPRTTVTTSIVLLHRAPRQ